MLTLYPAGNLPIAKSGAPGAQGSIMTSVDSEDIAKRLYMPDVMIVQISK